jgi:tetratricopeptide (TPR) repeat protein
MKPRCLWIVPVLALLGAGALGAADGRGLYEEGLAAAEAADYEAAFAKLEAAVAAEPDNLRYGTAYRQAVIAAAGDEKKELYERCIEFFKTLVAAHPEAANAYLNLAFAHVDKIPAEGAITQVILANTSLTYFGNALELEESWLGRYSRGHAYLFWPTIFGRAASGIADLEKAIAIARENGDPKPYHARAWAALGDGYWRLDDVDKAREVWTRGRELFPGDGELEARLSRTGREELDAYLEVHYDTGQRVATHLREILGRDAAGHDEPAPR